MKMDKAAWWFLGIAVVGIANICAAELYHCWRRRKQPTDASAQEAPAAPQEKLRFSEQEPPAGFGPTVLLKGTEVHVMLSLAPQVMDAPESPEGTWMLDHGQTALAVYRLGRDQSYEEFFVGTALQMGREFAPAFARFAPPTLAVTVSGFLRSEAGTLVPMDSQVFLLSTERARVPGEGGSQP